MLKIRLINPFDRDESTSLTVGTHQIGFATYDEHGSAGQQLLRDVAENLVKALKKEGIQVDYEELESESEEDDD